MLGGEQVIIASAWSSLGRHKIFLENLNKEHLTMKTILAINLGKHKSVLCKLDTSSLKPQYSTVKTDPETFHDIFADLDGGHSIVLFEVGSQAGWLADLLRAMALTFKVANVNHVNVG